MTLTENLIDGSGSNTYNFTFPILDLQDVKVQLREFDPNLPEEDQIVSQISTTAFDVFSSPNRVVFQPIAEETIYQDANGDVKVTSSNGYQVVIRIYRNTDINSTAAYFYPGSAIRAEDLNENFKQLIFSAQETDAELEDVLAGIFPDDSIPGSALKDGAVTTDKIADGAVTPEKLDREYVQKTGDNMTGDLTLGTNPASPKITLNAADGNISCKKLNVGDNSDLDYIARIVRKDDNDLPNLTIADSRTASAQKTRMIIEPSDDGVTIEANNTGATGRSILVPLESGHAVKLGGTLPADPAISLNAGGTATFNGLTTHKAGMNVQTKTSGSNALLIQTPGTSVEAGAYFSGTTKDGGAVPSFNGGVVSDVVFNEATQAANAYLARVRADTTNSNNPDLVGYFAYDFQNLNQYPTGYDGNVSGFYAGPAITFNSPNIKDGNVLAGFKSGLAAGINNTYNFYAEGSAPNYFKGNVGIGTDDPGERLTIQDSSGAIINIELGGSNADSVQGINMYGRFVNGVTPALPGQLTTYIHDERQSATSAFALTFGVSNGNDNATERMRINHVGDLLIGGTLPSAPNTRFYADGTADFTGNVTLPGGGGATQALQKQEIEDLISAGGGGGSGSGADAWGSVSKTGILENGQNIASTSLTSIGTFQITFSTPMPNANYSVTTGGQTGMIRALSKTVNGFVIETYADQSTKASVQFNFAVFATNALPPTGGTGTDAWAKCNGIGSFNASYNFASISRFGLGYYSLTFANPMPTAEYAVITGSDDTHTQIRTYNKSKIGFSVEIADPIAGATVDANFSVAVNATNATLPATLTRDMIVLKAGDTMTGDLEIDDADIILNDSGGDPRVSFQGAAGTGFFTGNLSCGRLTFPGVSNGFAWDWTPDAGGRLLQYVDNTPIGYLTYSSNNNIVLSWSTSSQVLATIDGTTSVLLGTASDYRLKENDRDCEYGTDAVKALRPVTYEISESGATQTGFIAHEAAEVIPGAATGEKDGELYQSINTYPIVAALTKALQESIERIEALEAKVQALENN
jgi:hypothetical protein